MADHVVVIKENSYFGPNRPEGFVVCAYVEREGKTTIQIPDWKKIGYDDLAVVFPTREAAERAVPILY